ncbi:MAG: TIGR01459 family HAD-type hydrolase [Rhodospirillaceae bacterium]|nr:TIGR01459 family HAD-type hydrolase [Rhodospirillaceae bacterium]
MTILRAIAGLSAVAEVYDGFILDLWGLVHDGATPYPPSRETFFALKAAGKRTLLLSNAPRRAYALVEAMTRMGLERDLYGEVLSSGEAVNQALIRRDDAFFQALGRRCYHLGPPRDQSVFDNTGLEIVHDLAAADFVLNTGPGELHETVATYEPVLQAAAGRHLPMVCANPDMVVMRAGNPVMCAGALAVRYTELGGKVAYRGKPDPAIYHLAVEQLGLPARKIAVVGDALETDVKGANAAGLDSIWCTGGIHAAALGTSYGAPADPAKATALATAEGQMPTAIIPGFYW